MEVLKRGNPPNEKVYEAECRQCHSLLRFEQVEARLVPDRRDGDYLEIPCPVCRYVVTVTP